MVISEAALCGSAVLNCIIFSVFLIFHVNEGTLSDTHHDTAVLHRDVLKRLHTEGSAAPFTLLGHSVHRI